MYTKSDILQTAKEQLAIDYNFNLEDLKKGGNIVVENKLNEGRRKNDKDEALFKLLCIGGQVVISANKEIIPWCEEKLLNLDGSWFFEFNVLRGIDNKLKEFGHRIGDIHHFYLPKMSDAEIKSNIDIRLYEGDEVLQFKGDKRFEEAFLFQEGLRDEIGLAALDGEKIMGMAGATSDSKTMWQMGIDILPEYRSRGIASSLVEILKEEILKRRKVPFYGTGEVHFKSQNVALNAGFYPVWAELYSQKIE